MVTIFGLDEFESDIDRFWNARALGMALLQGLGALCNNPHLRCEQVEW
jgi:hypothetical protein